LKSAVDTRPFDNLHEAAEKNLKKHLDWISRYDVRSSIIVGICVAMLGVIANVAPAVTKWTLLFEVLFSISGVLLLSCLVSIWISQFPRTRSPNASLLFFGTIAPMKSDEYLRRFRTMTQQEYLEDLLRQTHANAEILRRKFNALKSALVFLLFSIVPWATTVFCAKLVL
jgi:hypothetical protein